MEASVRPTTDGAAVAAASHGSIRRVRSKKTVGLARLGIRRPFGPAAA